VQTNWVCPSETQRFYKNDSDSSLELLIVTRFESFILWKMWLESSHSCSHRDSSRVRVTENRDSSREVPLNRVTLSLSLCPVKCCWITNCITEKAFAHVSWIFKDRADRYGEHYCKFSLQPNEYEKCYCALQNNFSHLILWKRLVA